MKKEPKTLVEMLKNSVELHGDRTAFKTKKQKDKKFQPISYRELYDKIESFGTGLKSIGLNEFDHLALISGNRLEWIIADSAIIGLRTVDVPQSESISHEDMYFKLDHSDSKAAILEGEKQFSDFYNHEKDLTGIKNIILFDKINIFSEKENAPEWANALDFKKDKKINKKFYSEIKSLLNKENKNIFLSKDAKHFLEKYLDKYIGKILQDRNHKRGIIESTKDSILKKTVVLDGDFYKRHKVYSFQEITNKGRELLKSGDKSFFNISKKAKPDDLVTIIYTSGTTGNPKGVMLTNKNFMHNIKNAPPAIGINKDDNFLSVLPSWHIYERTVEYCAISVGASTAYSKPFKQVLLPDLEEEKPTIMCSVPRIWESVHKGIINKIKKGSSIQKYIFNFALDIGKKYKEAERVINNENPLFDRENYSSEEIKKARKTVKTQGWKYKLADRLVFKKIREVTGGKLRFAISGGGALSESEDIFFNSIGVKVCEGYGLTETSPILAGRTEKENIIFTVGPSIPNVEIKIVDKDDYKKEMPNGEVGIVLTKGDMVMQGYYKNEKKTNEVIKDGWFNTGDLGKKTYNGKYLKIVGRIKDTIVLTGGENVEPLPLEDKLKESQYVNQVIVVGQDKPRLGALIVPDFESLKEYAQNNDIAYKTINDLIQKNEVLSFLQKEQKRLISKEHGFNPYETVMGIALLPDEFTIEKGEVTETLKMRRPQIHEKYKWLIDMICEKVS